jgi:hypothetical protein
MTVLIIIDQACLDLAFNKQPPNARPIATFTETIHNALLDWVFCVEQNDDTVWGQA